MLRLYNGSTLDQQINFNTLIDQKSKNPRLLWEGTKKELDKIHCLIFTVIKKNKKV